MKVRFFYIFLIFLTGFFACANPASAADYNLEKVFYLAQKNAVAGVASLEENWQKVDIVAPQMYSVTSNLQLAGGLGPKLKQLAKEKNLKVMPLVVNAGFSQKTIHKLLLSKKAQDNVILGLVALAQKNNYIGWQFDFENINYTDRDLFSAFVERTSAQFKKNNLILSVAVVARWSDFEDTEAFKNWSGVYDYARIAKAVDFISYMAYDDPNSKGPVASAPFVNACLDYAKKQIPAEKFSLGVPLYYWVWNADLNKRVGSGFFKSVVAVMQKYTYKLGFDQTLGVSCLSYAYNNKNYKIWFEDGQSFAQKLQIIKDNNLRGFSAWVLGGEDSGIWNVLRTKI